MRIETLFTPNEVDEAAVKGKTVAVVDVLRVCTTIAHALANGCERIIPVESVEAATNLTASLDKKVTLLGGEKEGRRIDGFNLGNSPLEYTPDVVKGKTIIMATTNGTRAIWRSQAAKEILIASFVNMATVADFVGRMGGGLLTIVCAGRQGRFAMEDAVCAGMLIDLLAKENDSDLSDGANAARLLYRMNEQSIENLLRECEHGRYLRSLGFEADIEACSKVDSLRILPVVKEGRIDRQKRARKA
ncbi:MAG: 2-phosphosulfolactate phosphatase [Candidatus Eisenbacteria bacterium]